MTGTSDYQLQQITCRSQTREKPRYQYVAKSSLVCVCIENCWLMHHCYFFCILLLLSVDVIIVTVLHFWLARNRLIDYYYLAGIKSDTVAVLTGQFADKPIHSQSSCRLVNSRTSQLANKAFFNTGKDYTIFLHRT